MGTKEKKDKDNKIKDLIVKGKVDNVNRSTGYKIITEEENKINVIIVVIFMLGVLSILIPMISRLSFQNNFNKSTDKYVEGVDYSNSEITTYSYEHELLKGEQSRQAVFDIMTYLDYVKDKSTYFRVLVGDNTYDYYVYNKDGECVSQLHDTGNLIIFRKDKSDSILYDGNNGELTIGQDFDILTHINSVLKAAYSEREDIKVFDMVIEDTSIKEYRIDIVGDRAFLDMYADINKELGEKLLQSIKTEIKNMFNIDYVPHVIYTFILDKESKVFSTSCNFVINGKEELNWAQSGYLELDDWSLDEKWYTTDYNNVYAEEIIGMVQDVVKTVDGLIEKFVLDNNIYTEEELEQIKKEYEDLISGNATESNTTGESDVSGNVDDDKADSSTQESEEGDINENIGSSTE